LFIEIYNSPLAKEPYYKGIFMSLKLPMSSTWPHPHPLEGFSQHFEVKNLIDKGKTDIIINKIQKKLPKSFTLT
jgi:hypothetical protein